MLAMCLNNRSSALSDHQRGRFVGLDEEHYLTIGKVYVVLGMGIFETVLYLLVRDDTGGPAFAHAAMFDCSAQPIPPDWFFTLQDGIRASGNELWSHPTVAMWGYDALVNDPRHAAMLGEQEPSAIRRFMEEFARRSRETGS
ncbi:MAG: hypothetical protein IPI38_19015 [Gemmatimonadetes bacterium]|nr:hypothetical protein [Gemmatimonadota bacterium]